jgi:hypothetical protein
MLLFGVLKCLRQYAWDVQRLHVEFRSGDVLLTIQYDARSMAFSDQIIHYEKKEYVPQLMESVRNSDK